MFVSVFISYKYEYRSKSFLEQMISEESQELYYIFSIIIFFIIIIAFLIKLSKNLIKNVKKQLETKKLHVENLKAKELETEGLYFENLKAKQLETERLYFENLKAKQLETERLYFSIDDFNENKLQNQDSYNEQSQLETDSIQASITEITRKLSLEKLEKINFFSHISIIFNICKFSLIFDFFKKFYSTFPWAFLFIFFILIISPMISDFLSDIILFIFFLRFVIFILPYINNIYDSRKFKEN